MGRRLFGRSRARPILLALSLLLLAACAAASDKSDDDRRGGFYGGLSGGMTRLP